MIIWTGWGVLTIFFYAIAGAIGAFVGEAIFPGDRQGMKLVLIGVLFLGASVGLWFAGRALNVTAPAGKVQSTSRIARTTTRASRSPVSFRRPSSFLRRSRRSRAKRSFTSVCRLIHCSSRRVSGTDTRCSGSRCSGGR